MAHHELESPRKVAKIYLLFFLELYPFSLSISLPFVYLFGVPFRREDAADIKDCRCVEITLLLVHNSC